VCTNRQFAAMVQARPQSLSKLAEIEGFGKAKLEKYGQEILALLRQSPAPDTPSAPHEMSDGRAHP
jgi:superfamily II DNA helicase RecQ